MRCSSSLKTDLKKCSQSLNLFAKLKLVMTDSEGGNVISSSVAVFSAGDFPQAAIIHSTKPTWWPLIKQNTFNNLNKILSFHLLLSHNRKEVNIMSHLPN